MGLNNFTFASALNFTLSSPVLITGFNVPAVADGLTASMAGLNVTTWNTLYASDLLIPPATTTSVDLTAAPSFFCGNITFTKVLGIWIQYLAVANGLPALSPIHYGPQSISNSLNWYWNASTAYNIINPGGFFPWFDGVAGTGATVNGSNKLLNFHNTTALATAWSAVTTYIIGDVVSVAGNNYICILGNINHTPPNTLYWTLAGVSTVTVCVLGQS